jgi:hypothetical protein
VLIYVLQVVGGLHHGKTTLLDMLVEQTHDVAALGIRNSQGKPLRFTDTRVDEQVGHACRHTLCMCCRFGSPAVLALAGNQRDNPVFAG